jgi:hypothetical protein
VPNATLIRINRCAKMLVQQPPRICIPLETISSNPPKVTYQGHVILPDGQGIFLEKHFDSESEAMEDSANFINDFLTNQNISANSNDFHTNK